MSLSSIVLNEQCVIKGRALSLVLPILKSFLSLSPLRKSKLQSILKFRLLNQSFPCTVTVIKPWGSKSYLHQTHKHRKIICKLFFIINRLHTIQQKLRQKICLKPLSQNPSFNIHYIVNEWIQMTKNYLKSDQAILTKTQFQKLLL